MTLWRYRNVCIIIITGISNRECMTLKGDWLPVLSEFCWTVGFIMFDLDLLSA